MVVGSGNVDEIAFRGTFLAWASRVAPGAVAIDGSDVFGRA
jgi:hypothetical protein